MLTENSSGLSARIHAALAARTAYADPPHVSAWRAYSGFYEGHPELVADVYARTLVLYSYTSEMEAGDQLLNAAQSVFLEALPWIDCVVQKRRRVQMDAGRRGAITFGQKPANKIMEYGVWYALDLLMNQDASFYLDTRDLRRWLVDQAAGWRVLNLFAYTGSLGIAALSGGADYVEQVDRSRKFLALARRSLSLNGLPTESMALQTADFFRRVAFHKHQKNMFDCVIVDPPFFASSTSGKVDLVRESTRLINKVRPLVRHGGYLVVVNNALFLSGADYIKSLEALCADGYLTITKIIPVPADITGYRQTIASQPPVDPAPYNHSTKITVLSVRRKAAGP
jgi:23S rRNA (cytosine1962-C5)-methyltransferase